MLCHCAQKVPFCKRGHELTVSVGYCKDRCWLPPFQGLVNSRSGYYPQPQWLFG